MNLVIECRYKILQDDIFLIRKMLTILQRNNAGSVLKMEVTLIHY